MGICRLWNGFLRMLVGSDRKPAQAGGRKCCACLTARLISVEMTTFLPACLRPAWTDPPNGIAQASTGLATLRQPYCVNN